MSNRKAMIFFQLTKNKNKTFKTLYELLVNYHVHFNVDT
jgi:hypothetical protein